MNNHQISYLIFGIVMVIALLFDLGLVSKKNKVISVQAAIKQTMFWVALALSFMVFIWYQEGRQPALEYMSAYLMEWSLSIDNIFVFILIFSAFDIDEKHYARVLLAGILMAVLFRIIFITVGVTIVSKAKWILYIFGVFLVYTGYKMFVQKEDEKTFNPKESKIYTKLQKLLPLVPHDGNGKYIVRENGKKFFTILTVIIIMLGLIDLLFALDSIPAVMGITRNKLIIYSSNIFAVLGLRSLFFLLRNAVNQFNYLQQGIAIVLIFIGIKMLGEHYISQWLSKPTQVALSLGVIICSLSGAIVFSMYRKKNKN